MSRLVEEEAGRWQGPTGTYQGHRCREAIRSYEHSRWAQRYRLKKYPARAGRLRWVTADAGVPAAQRTPKQIREVIFGDPPYRPGGSSLFPADLNKPPGADGETVGQQFKPPVSNVSLRCGDAAGSRLHDLIDNQLKVTGRTTWRSVADRLVTS